MPEADDIGAVREEIEQGLLPVQRCHACGEWIWFPRVACPRCFSSELGWQKASGLGEVISVAVVERTHNADYEPHLPIVLAFVALDEGCEMVTTMVGPDRVRTSIGDRVRVASTDRWSTLPQFTRATPEAES